jgi:hypothetical protein
MTIKSGIATLLLMACLGCSGQGSFFKKSPVITQAEFFPKYIGENTNTVTFEWEGQNFSRLEVITAAGDPFLVLRSPQGSVTTPPISSDILPLQAVAWRKGEGVAVPIELTIAEKPTWTQPYVSVQENGGDLEPKFSRVVQEPGQDGTYKTIKVYDLYQAFESFTWDIPDADFSDDVVLQKVKNASEYPLIISGRGIKERTVAPDSVLVVPANTPLGGEWTLKFVDPDKRKVGEQRGESEEGISISDVPRIAQLQFLIRSEKTSVISEKKQKKSF